MKRIILCIALAVSGCYSIPGTGPAPKPPAITKSESLWIITVDDALMRGDYSKDQRKLMTDLEYWRGLEQRGHHRRNVDAKSALAQKYAPQVTQAGGIPCLILIDAATKKQLLATKLPASEAALTDTVKQYSDR